MAGIGKLITGTFVFLIALLLSFTIIGIIFALPLFTTAFGMWAAGLAELGFKTSKAIHKATRKT